MFLSAAPQQQVIVQDSKILQHMSATGMVSEYVTHKMNRSSTIIVWDFTSVRITDLHRI